MVAPLPTARAARRVGTVNYQVPDRGRPTYHIDAGGESGRLVSPPHAPVQVTLADEREDAVSMTFAADGVAFVTAPSRVAAFPDAGGWRATYDAELTTLLTREVGAHEVVVFDHTVRVDDPDALRRPARNVHTDYSPAGARQRLDDILGPERAAEWAAGHYAFINVWRPIGAPVNSAPLAFVRPASVPADDWLLIDLIYPDRVGQIMGLVPRAAHEWVYRSKMAPDEVVFFNIHDNRGRPPVAHSAVDLIEDPQVPAVRRSVESRTLVRFAS